MPDITPTPTHTILAVDDAPQNLSLLSDLLEVRYKVKLAPSGARALTIATRTPPDLILLDIMMPEMDGYEVIRRLKDHHASKNIPVIFVTSLTGEGHKAKGLELGAVDYITKPINPELLLATVSQHLGL